MFLSRCGCSIHCCLCTALYNCCLCCILCCRLCAAVYAVYSAEMLHTLLCILCLSELLLGVAPHSGMFAPEWAVARSFSTLRFIECIFLVVSAHSEHIWLVPDILQSQQLKGHATVLTHYLEEWIYVELVCVSIHSSRWIHTAWKITYAM